LAALFHHPRVIELALDLPRWLSIFAAQLPILAFSPIGMILLDTKVDKPMYAVIRTGGKQYRVAKDDIIAIEKLDGKAGDKVKFDEVLMLGEAGKEPKIGEPVLKGASVTAEVLEQGRANKISVIKFKRRKNYHRNKGHRQHETVLKITAISAKAAAKKAAPKAEASEDAAEE
jgi:large subunit ribosomal protein L21